MVTPAVVTPTGRPLQTGAMSIHARSFRRHLAPSGADGDPLVRLSHGLAAGQRNDLCHRLSIDGSFARTACLVAQQPVHAVLSKTLLPAPDHRSADTKLLGDLLHRTILGRGKHDVGSLNMLVRAVTIRDDRQQAVAVS